MEGSACNLFWVDNAVVCTPPLTGGILAGVTRAVILEICQSLCIPTREAQATVDELKSMSGVFASLSSWGVIEAESLDGAALRRSAVVGRIREAHFGLLRMETA